VKFLAVLSFLFSHYLNANDISLEKKINLLICTEEAPALCPYFGLTKEHAKKDVNKLCSDSTEGNWGIKAIWKNDKIIAVKCDFKDGSISNNYCNSIGFDCGMDNQCVNHGEVRPGVETSQDYMLAKELVSLNPVNIYNFPHLFFACVNVPL